DGLDVTGVSLLSPALTWEFVRRVKESTKMRLVVKGIETREDAALCVSHGVDGIVVSNHGGRAQEGGRATIECLPEVVDAVQGKIPVLIDGGVRRGADNFKALPLGGGGGCLRPPDRGGVGGLVPPRGGGGLGRPTPGRWRSWCGPPARRRSPGSTGASSWTCAGRRAGA